MSISVSVFAGDSDYVDRYRHIHSSKPVMIPVDRPVMPHEGRSTYLHAFFCLYSSHPSSI